MKIRRFGVPDERFRNYSQPCDCECSGGGMPCGLNPTKEQLANALFVENKETKCVYLNVCLTRVSTDDCTDYQPAVTCGVPITKETFVQMLAKAIDTDDCGNPRIRLISFCE